MNDKAYKEELQPGLIRNYRPVAIRSVVAVHAMIPQLRPNANAESTASATGPALPAGFHSPPED